jgi:hypothetical protein
MEYTDEAADGEEGQENEVVEELDAEADWSCLSCFVLAGRS